MSLVSGPGRASNASGFAPAPSIGPSVSPYAPPPGASTTFAAPPPPPGASTSFAQPPPPPNNFAGPGSYVPPHNVGAQSQHSLPPNRGEPPPLSATMGPMPGTLPNPIVGPKKRLIITCDGTWLDQDNGIVNGQRQPPSNVSRLGWSLKETSRDGIPQVVNYQAGIGTVGGRLSRVVGGATGMGLKENIREAYTYLAANWRAGDEIFLLGFSRGAFTARSVGGMIGSIGLLTRKGLPLFSEIFEDWEHRADERYVSSMPDSPFPDKGPFDERYVMELERLGITQRRVPIKAICCWDTVGNLGIPRSTWLDSFAGRDRKVKDYQFVDTRIHPCVENAFHALALDEMRAPFSPAIWEKQSDNNVTNLKQVWFPGVHSNVGGGYDDQELANLTLAWMMSRLEPFLDFRPDFLVSQLDAQRNYYKETSQKPRWWAFGEIYQSLKGPYSIAGKKVRTPGAYQRIDPLTGRSTGKKLKNTNEYIHASVRARIGLKGPGPQDRGDYNPQALADWTFDPEPAPPGSAAQGQGGNLSDGMMVVWNYRGGKERDGQTRIPEAVLLETELALLRQFHAVDDYIRFMRQPSGSKRRSKRYHGMNGAVPMSGAVPVNGAPPMNGPPPMTGPPPINGPPPMYDGRRRSLGPAPDDFAEPVDGEMDVPEDDHERRRARRHHRRTRGTSIDPDSPVDEYPSRRKERDPDREERRRRRQSAKY